MLGGGGGVALVTIRAYMGGGHLSPSKYQEKRKGIKEKMAQKKRNTLKIEQVIEIVTEICLLVMQGMGEKFISPLS